MVEYLKQMSEIVADSTGEEADAALGAIVQEIKGKEGLVATDQKLSKVLERLISTNPTKTSIIAPIFGQLNTVVLDLVYDQYGSHVYETILGSLLLAPMSESLEKIIDQFVDSISSDILEVICDVRATYVLRAAALVFTGFSKPEGDDVVDCVSKMASPVCVLPAVFVRGFERLMATLFDCSDSLLRISSSVHSCVTLQLLLALSAKVSFPACETFIKSMVRVEKTMDHTFIAESLNDRVRSKLMEGMVVILNSNGSKFGSKILSSVMSDECFDLKFIFGWLQAYVSSLRDQEMFGKLADLVWKASVLRECITKGRGNGIALIQRFAEKSVEFVEFQKPFITVLLEIVPGPASNIWGRLLAFSPTETALEEEFDETRITPQGCLLVSTLMGFKQAPIQPMISNTASLVQHIQSQKVGVSKFFTELGPGRTLQTIMSSNCALPTGIKKKIIRAVIFRPTEELALLAADRKVGSWMITTVWDSCNGDVTLKQQIAEELLKIENLRELNWKIWKHCDLIAFTRRNEQWTTTETRKAKVHNVFKDIIGQGAKKSRN